MVKWRGRPSVEFEDRRPSTDGEFPSNWQKNDFLIDSFKRAREVGLRMDWSKFGIMMVPWEGDSYMPASNSIAVENGGTWQSPVTWASRKIVTKIDDLSQVEIMATQANQNKRIRVIK